MQQLSSVSYATEIKESADGLPTYRETRVGSELLGMFYCFGQVWQGWGNLQARALPEAYSITAIALIRMP